MSNPTLEQQQAQERLKKYQGMNPTELLRYRDDWHKSVVAQVKLTANQRRVLDVVTENMGVSDSRGYKKGVCKLTNERIASIIGMQGKRVNERIRRYLKPLIDCHALLVVQNGAGGSGRMKRARHMTMGDLQISTPTKAKSQPPQTEPQPPQNMSCQPPQNTGSQPPQNESQPPQNCGGSLDQRSRIDKKIEVDIDSSRAREAHAVAEGMPPEIEGMTYWELEMMGVWLDGSSSHDVALPAVA